MKKNSLVLPLAIGIVLAITVLILEFRTSSPENRAGRDPTPRMATAAPTPGREASIDPTPEAVLATNRTGREASIVPTPEAVVATNRTGREASIDPMPEAVVATNHAERDPTPRMAAVAPTPGRDVTPRTNPDATPRTKNVPKNHQVVLAHRTIAVEKRKFPTRFCTTQTPTSRNTAPYVLVCELPVDRSVQSQALADGARIAGCLPHNALLIEATAEALKTLSEDILFFAAVEYEPLDKIQPRLLKSGDDKIAVNVTLMNAGYREAICAFVTANQGTVLAEKTTPKNKFHSKTFGAEIPRKLIIELARLGEIRWIETRK